jgi:hypothetical protein
LFAAFTGALKRFRVGSHTNQRSPRWPESSYLMALSAHDQSRIREYLLGHLSHEEQDHLEEQLLVDGDLSEELEISKRELIEEYCAGELTKRERQWFESNYLASREGRLQYILTVAISYLSSSS